MFMKRLRLYAAVLALALAGGALSLSAGATSSAASAIPGHAAPAAISARTSAQIQNGTAKGNADAVCPIVPDKFTIYASSCSQPWSHVCSGSGYTPYAPDFVANGCATRAWIYQTGVRAGYNRCVNPDQGVSTHETFTYFYISPDTSPC